MATAFRTRRGDPLTRAWEHLVNTLPAPAEERGYPGSYERFIEDVLGLTLTDKQREIIHSVQHNRRTAARSCHAGGKSMALAALAIAFLHIHSRSKVIITGPSDVHVKDIIWANMRALSESSQGRLLGKPLESMRWEISPGWYAVGIKPSNYNPGSIQGYHAPNVLVIADEAAEVSKTILDALESLMTGGGAKMVWGGNPTEVSGPFYDAFHENSELWSLVTIRASDTPNIAAGRIVVPGLLDQAWIDEQIHIHGEDSDWVQARVYAEFPRNQATAWVPLAQVDRSQRNTEAGMFALVPGKPIDIGLDVARSGDDKSVLVWRQGDYVIDAVEWKIGNLMESVATVRYQLQAKRDELTKLTGEAVVYRHLNIDETGLGSGLVDRLSEIHKDKQLPVARVIGINFGAKSSDPEKWPNLRQEMWYGLKERFREDRIGGFLHKLFIADVTGAKIVPHSTYSMPQVERKDEMKKRLHRSPDYADGYALAFYESARKPPPAVAAVSMPHTSTW